MRMRRRNALQEMKTVRKKPEKALRNFGGRLRASTGPAIRSVRRRSTRLSARKYHCPPVAITQLMAARGMVRYLRFTGRTHWAAARPSKGSPARKNSTGILEV